MLGMWATSLPKWKKVPGSLFHQLQEMEEKKKKGMKIYKAIHGDNFKMIQKAKRFIVSA